MKPLRVGTLFLCVFLAFSVRGADAAPSRQTAATVVSTYYASLNAAMQTGDFSTVAAVYASDAVLTWSNPLGATKVFKGRTAIVGYYTALYAKVPRLHFTLIGNARNLSASIVLRYETAGAPSLAVPARCMHVFMVQSGLIVSDDWVTYFPGK